MGSMDLRGSRIFKAVVSLRTWIVLAALGLLGIGLLLLMSALVPGDWFQATIRATLSRSGVSEYHIKTYVTADRLVSARRKASWLALGCLGLAAGIWWKGEGLFGTLRRAISRLRILLLWRTEGERRHWCRILDGLAGGILLAVLVGCMIRSMVALPVACDEATMYDSVCSSALPLWAVAYIAPNNHVGFAWLVWVGHFVWGDSVPGMRVFSLLAWALSAAMLCQIMREVAGWFSLSLITLGLGLPYVATLGIQSRGYALGGAGALRYDFSGFACGIAAGHGLGGRARWVRTVGRPLEPLWDRTRGRGDPLAGRSSSRGAAPALGVLGGGGRTRGGALYAHCAGLRGPGRASRIPTSDPSPGGRSGKSTPAGSAQHSGSLSGAFAKATLGCAALGWSVGSRVSARWARVPAVLACGVVFLPLPQHVLPYTRVMAFAAPLALVLAGSAGPRSFRTLYATLAVATTLSLTFQGMTVVGYNLRSVYYIDGVWMSARLVPPRRRRGLPHRGRESSRRTAMAPIMAVCVSTSDEPVGTDR